MTAHEPSGPAVAVPGVPGLAVHREDGVLRLVLDRPDRLNAVTAAMLHGLADQVEAVAADASVRVVVLTGSGRAFCSGADLAGDGIDPRSLPSPPTLDAAERLVHGLQAAPQPVVAAVNGPAVGIGCSIALACDLVVAAESAYFLLSFTNIGLMPDGGATLLVPSSIGRALAMEMALVPERVPAAQARQWGLIHRAVPDADLDGAVSALVARLAAGPRDAQAAAKRAVNHATLPGLDAALARERAGQVELLRTADFAEGVAAFAARRPPAFPSAASPPA